LIEAMGEGKGPKQSLFIMGYAGWAPGQLEGELLAGSWFVVPGDKALIFDPDADQKWRQAMDKRQIPLSPPPVTPPSTLTVRFKVELQEPTNRWRRKKHVTHRGS